MTRKTTRKRSPTSRRLRPGLDADQLVNVHRKLQRGDDLGLGERRWLEGLLKDLLADRDVREHFYLTTRGAPADQDRKFWCAMWIANRPTGATVTDAKDAALEHWRLSFDQVRIAWREHREQAIQTVASSPDRDALGEVIEYHRTGGDNSR